MTNYVIQAVDRSGYPLDPNRAWETDPAHLPAEPVTDPLWRDGQPHGRNYTGGWRWYALSKASHLSALWLSVAGEIHRMTALDLGDSPNMCAAPIVLLGISNARSRRYSGDTSAFGGIAWLPGDQPSCESVTVAWSSRSVAAAEAMVSSLDTLYAARRAAVGYFAPYAAAEAAYKTALTTYVDLIRVAVTAQLPTA